MTNIFTNTIGADKPTFFNGAISPSILSKRDGEHMCEQRQSILIRPYCIVQLHRMYLDNKFSHEREYSNVEHVHYSSRISLS